MTRVQDADRDAFLADVDRAARAASGWMALATVAADQARVRIVHGTWEGDTLWFATAPDSPKAAQMRDNPSVDVQFQVAPPDFVHVMVRGRAELCSDDETREHVWDVMDYDLSAFWPGGPTDPGYVAVRVVPTRIELSKMFGSQDKRVWRSA